MSLQRVTNPPALDSTAQRIANALEARNDDMGSLSGLTTDAKTSLAAAINEVDAHADTNATNIASNLSKINILINILVHHLLRHSRQLWLQVTSQSFGTVTFG